MDGRKYDIAIAGGGLSGGLIALALSQRRPELDIILIEGGPDLGGNHRWSWFESDLSPAGAQLLSVFRKTSWDTGYDVRFPGHMRSLPTPYRSLLSDEYDAGLNRELPEGAIMTGCMAQTLDSDGITLADGRRIAARTVIDCRGAAPSPHLRGGWQVFMGRHIRTDNPHGVEQPIIMDAAIDQHDAYRFVYVLPLGAHDLFVEDTYYADDPMLDRRALSQRIDAYCAQYGWQGEIVGGETGILPVITGGDFKAFQAAQRSPGVAIAGARGGFVHPLTSYSLPQATETALAIAADADLSGAQLAALIEARARSHWRKTRFYRRLGKMLFNAARPSERWRIFERFYRLPQPLIERFYAARSTRADRLRILCGKPPVPIGRALEALISPGTPMARSVEL